MLRILQLHLSKTPSSFKSQRTGAHGLHMEEGRTRSSVGSTTSAPQVPDTANQDKRRTHPDMPLTLRDSVRTRVQKRAGG